MQVRKIGNMATKPYFTRVSLSFSAGNTAATVGNMLLLFGEIFNHREQVCGLSKGKSLNSSFLF
jgi:hypothetical protein